MSQRFPWNGMKSKQGFQAASTVTLRSQVTKTRAERESKKPFGPTFWLQANKMFHQQKSFRRSENLVSYKNCQHPHSTDEREKSQWGRTTQGHAASIWWNQSLNPCFLIPKSCPLFSTPYHLPGIQSYHSPYDMNPRWNAGQITSPQAM